MHKKKGEFKGQSTQEVDGGVRTIVERNQHKQQRLFHQIRQQNNNQLCITHASSLRQTSHHVHQQQQTKWRAGEPTARATIEQGRINTGLKVSLWL